MPSNDTNIAIIGAGLTGLALALALHDQSIPSTIYEARPASLDIGGAIMLSPNALKVLDRLGVYERIRPEGYEFENLYFRTQEHDQLVDTFEFGNERKYGYKALRVYRRVLIREMLGLIEEKNKKDDGIRIDIQYGKKFTKIISETDSDVQWEFEDGTSGRATFLVGADGIHSRVRKHLHPDIQPRFTNMVGVTAAVPTDQLHLPDGYQHQLPVTIMNKKYGAFVIAPQLPDGSEVLIGKQRKAPELDREGWNRLLTDQNKDWCIDFLRDGAEEFPEIVQNAVSNIDLDRINLWPFYLVPKLGTWMSSEHHRVILLGDAAHAIPPTAGQGVNQAFEDVYTFGLVMGAVCGEETITIAHALTLWQQHRQTRIDKVLALNDQINERRMPKEPSDVDEDEAVPKEFDLDWLYRIDFEKTVEGLLEEVNSSLKKKECPISAFLARTCMDRKVQ